jgi:hypothetical protein
MLKTSETMLKNSESAHKNAHSEASCILIVSQPQPLEDLRGDVGGR